MARGSSGGSALTTVIDLVRSAPSVTTPAGTFANALHIHEQRGSGYVRDVWYAPGVGVVMMKDATGTAMLTGYTIPGAAVPPAVPPHSRSHR